MASADESTSPVADAAELGDWQRVADLIKAGEDPGAAQADGMTALHWAAEKRSFVGAHRLVEAGADPNATTRYGVTPLSIACLRGSEPVVCRLLAAGADAEKRLPGGETPLMTAARGHGADIARRLLKHGVDAEATGGREQTALMWAASAGNTPFVEELIDAGADIEKRSAGGFTALMFASRDGQLACVRALLAAGANANAAIEKKKGDGRAPRAGTSALLMAVESAHFEIALELVRGGADPNDQRSGYSPLHALSWVRRPARGDNPAGDPPPRGSGKVTALAFVKRLVEAGADIDLQLDRGAGGRVVVNPKGSTPFLFAAKTADVPLMRALLNAGADPSIKNDDVSSPLLAAAGIGAKAVGEEPGTPDEVIAAIELLLELGADINHVDKNRETAMHGAAYRNFPSVVLRLAELGADPAVWDKKNRYGTTPTMIARGKRPGSFKPSPETVAALEAARQRQQRTANNAAANSAQVADAGSGAEVADASLNVAP